MELGADLFRGSRWLITGGSGFVAANLVRNPMLAGAEVHLAVRGRSAWRLAGLDRSVRLHVLDLRDPDAVAALFAEVRPEIVVHGATWRGGADREQAALTNVLGTSHLIDAALAHPPRRLIHLGSSIEYGHREAPLDEGLALEPTTLHGATKAAASLLLRQAAWAEGLPAVILRAFSVYGPWEGHDRLIPTAIRALRDGAVVKLTEPGWVRDLVYVDDVVEAIGLAVVRELTPGEVLNVGSGIETTNEGIVETIARVMGRKAEVEVGAYPSRDTDSRHWVADPSRALERLGWRAVTPLEKGLGRTVEWVLTYDRS